MTHVKRWLGIGFCAIALAGCGGDDAEPKGVDVVTNNSSECAQEECNGDTVNNSGGNSGNNSDAVATLLGTAETATFTSVYSPQQPTGAPDLEFHPDRDQLWIVNRRAKVEGECTQSNPTSERCRSLAGFTTIIDAPGTDDQNARVLEDGNSWHFMRRPPSIAMGDNGLFATCGEAATGNFEDNDVMFIGPSLWETDLSIYAQPSGGNGSHMDMLHATPWCVGIAHEVDNVYWLFNGHVGSLDRYDFAEHHGPGNDDHSDGTIHRYVEGELSRVEDVPGHLVIDDSTNLLYVADTGNGRIISIDVTAGEQGGMFQPVYEELAEWGTMENVTVTEFVAPGTLDRPSGIALHEGTLYVSDNATGMLHAFDIETGDELASLQTELGDGELAGIEVGPNGKIWFTNLTSGELFRLDVAE